ncbi:hypothetical protein KP509_06G005100 [Ceratopteris richardii]|nr:hypothetical protein KP509_06G005100 [Ceratopteris richardii]
MLGITCHFCRQKTTEKKVLCRACVLAFCGPCLQNRHGEELEFELADDNWLCPKCRGGCGPGCKNCCNCTFCRKKQGLKPPKVTTRELQAHGFDNVHDYLIYLETGESFESIAARKLGKGWCSSIEKKHPISAQDSPDLKHRVRMQSEMEESTKAVIGASETTICKTKHCEKLTQKYDQKCNAPECERSESSSFLSHELFMSTQHESRKRSEDLFPEQFRTLNEFKHKLEAKLARPFDAKELKELWDAITYRKPLCKLSETQQGVISRTTKELGLAYIHHHPDLAAKYTATGEAEVKLKLLRGFFFWLEHASMPGAFKPWKDGDKYDECLEVDGPDCEVLGVVLNIEENQELEVPVQDGEDKDDKKPDKVLLEKLTSQKEVIFISDEEDSKPHVDEIKPQLYRFASKLEDVKPQLDDIKPKLCKMAIPVQDEEDKDDKKPDKVLLEKITSQKEVIFIWDDIKPKQYNFTSKLDDVKPKKQDMTSWHTIS